MDFENHITTAVLGAKGSGKSVLLATITNNFKGKKVILFDMLGVYNPKMPNKTAIVPNSYYLVKPKELIRKWRQFPKDAKIIIDFSHYIEDELVEIIDEICNFLMKQREPVAVLSDEVADFIPQSGKISYAFWRMVKNGRNFGIKPVIFATQRPQDVNKKVFDLCDIFLVSKQRAPRTVDYIIEVLNSRGDKALRDKIFALPPRTFLIMDGDQITEYKVPVYPYAFKQ